MPDDLNALRHIEGFPIGEDADILALSDPPHYTAYPNPHIAEFIAKWGKPYDEATDDYHREPYVADVSEGKNDPIYNAHSYHTKVPYKAIIPFIEHYTEPGDIVFDGFCGTGMTGVAAQMAGRRAILCDLSPAATFIAYNYNTPVDGDAFEREARRILAEVEAECEWMYETRHTDGRKARVNYTLWSDVFLCSYCGKRIVFWNVAIDRTTGKVQDIFFCPSCGAQVAKRDLPRSMETISLGSQTHRVQRAEQIPVLIDYSVGRIRTDKRPDPADIELIGRVNRSEIPHWYPSNRMMNMPEGAQHWGDKWRAGTSNFVYLQELYTRRNLWTAACLWDRLQQASTKRIQLVLGFVFTAATQVSTRMSSFRFDTRNPNNAAGGIMKGTFYVPSLSKEAFVSDLYNRKRNLVAEQYRKVPRISGATVVTTQSSTDLSQIGTDTVDYIFTDPPFGDNLMYSELNFLWEAWLRVFTNNEAEAIISKTQRKGLEDYRGLMTASFAEMYRILKPGRWITVVFHNSRASVWNAIQEGLARAGFLVAQVTVIDKQQGSFNQVSSAGSVKNDLVINAYKPRAGFTQRFISTAGQGQEAEFVRQHLRQLPLAANAERSREMLYSKYLAYYVQHGYQVAYNGDQFYRALAQWGLVERDSYWFADEAQANEYEARKTRKGAKGVQEQAVLFISDERSARQWLWNFLAAPQSYSDIYTAYVKALQTSEDQLPELRTMLEEGFMPVGSQWRRPDTLTQAELERRRQDRLLRQFEEYLATAKGGRPLKEVRKEALVAGFIEAYRTGRYADILAVGRKLPKRLLEDSPDIYDFVDIAEAKVEG